MSCGDPWVTAAGSEGERRLGMVKGRRALGAKNG